MAITSPRSPREYQRSHLRRKMEVGRGCCCGRLALVLFLFVVEIGGILRMLLVLGDTGKEGFADLCRVRLFLCRGLFVRVRDLGLSSWGLGKGPPNFFFDTE